MGNDRAQRSEIRGRMGEGRRQKVDDCEIDKA